MVVLPECQRLGRLAVDRVSIDSCHGRELELIWLGDSPSASTFFAPCPQYTRATTTGWFAGYICHPQKGEKCLWLTLTECHC